ncbi:Holliday junction branch migration protein RuvA [candidate division WOR-3 bacterium]|uniref:Holliday junction branch migration complex subunit RuvA n=1 Tax=candidate division TA06 bacterium TaxID=2250710 RepID=A0A660SD39_UNCT6|nr:Holliday junction branch migration protein RuvA [candidate division WOR-3 bacterium]RKX68096.1 MAG: Holliday junction branch migration protein RuvA [candidate division TA06 bacterium]HHD82481.1 Holliday junction branch migration protein RuvA [Bacteroidota bacterium]
MIERISGILTDKDPLSCLIDVNGIGYRINIPVSVSSILPEINSHVSLYTVMIIRQEKIELFGFGTNEERNMFLDLISISGIGPRTALSILSGFSPKEIYDNVTKGDISSFIRIKGIGKKTGERLFVELKNKLNVDVTIPDRVNESKFNDAARALMQLGYKRNDAEKKVGKILKRDSNLTIEEIIKLALQEK